VPQTNQGTILVTGARSGIGAAVCRALLAEGRSVIGVSRTIRESDFKQGDFHALNCDLSDFNALETLIKPLLKSDIELSAIVFCAGAGYFGGLEQLSFKRIQSLIDLNLVSPICLSKLVLPHFKKRKAGHLIYIGSEAALQGTKNGTAYCAAKFGLRGFVQALTAESRQSGVSVSLINPGMVDTAFFDGLHFKPGPDSSNRIPPESIAACVQAVLKMDQNTLIEEINLSPRNKVVSFK